jgi:hypothetical protein
METKRRGAKKIKVPLLLGTKNLKRRIAKIKKRKAGFYPPTLKTTGSARG